MKLMILGDLHCRSVWKDIVAKENADKIVFLGDYTCPRDVKFDDPTDACGFLYDVLDFKDKNPDKVVLLRGNHDLDALGYYWARCYPQDHPKVAQYWQTEDVKNWFLRNTQWVYRIPATNIVCSHAGISVNWLGFKRAVDADRIDSVIYDPPITVWDRINSMSPSELFGFTEDNPFDTSGESKCQPCTWIRPYTLLQCGVENIIHVVGHTPVDHICNFKKKFIDEARRHEELFEEKKGDYENYAEIWCCDCLKNREYLIIEDGEFKPCKL